MSSQSESIASRIYNSAVALLARREHSYLELQQKLQRKYPSMDDCIDQVLERLQGQGYLSDSRYAHSLVRTRVARGYGAERIFAELLSKGVDRELAQHALEEAEVDWLEVIHQVWRKRFGEAPADPREKQKHIRFLHYRGFTGDQIARLMKIAEE